MRGRFLAGSSTIPRMPSASPKPLSWPARSANCRQVIVYGIEGESFDFGMGLSPAVERAVAAVVEQAAKEVREVLSAKGDRR